MTRPSVPYTDHDEPVDQAGRLAAFAPGIALIALVAALIALGVSVFARPDDLAACRRAAWAAIPNSGELPPGWSLGTTDLNANGMTISITGPTSTDASAAAPVVYASITCYGDVAGTALAQNRTAAEDAGAKVTSRGGDAYDVDNAATGSSTTLFRVGPLVGQVADAGSASPTELARITRAVANAMGDSSAAGQAGAGASDLAESSDQPGASDLPPEESGSPAAPELEVKLPTEVADTALTVDSTTGDTVFGDNDPGSRALAARLRTLGASLSQLQVAQAFDDSGNIDLGIFAFRLPGKDVQKLRAAIVETWLSATGPGVTQTEVTLGGKKLTKIDYGDGSSPQYVYTGSDYVVTISSSDSAIATEAATKLK